ncbi:MAG: ATP-binding protein [Chloroflexi bacterium]|nr:ATP-binding protein [Chloroflexota bacterium]
MALSNYDRVGKALELLRDGVRPFLAQEMQAEYGQMWVTQARYSLRDGFDSEEAHLDSAALLKIMWDQWNAVFSKTLGHTERSLVSELREIRNRWAHQEAFSSDDAYRALDSAARLLTAIAAPQTRELEQHKQELLRIRFTEQARNERRKAAVAPIEGQPLGGLPSWRAVVTPHPDVASGRYSQTEFAADLAAVHRGDAGAASEYTDPAEFYQRTFLTEGLRQLLITALRRLSGNGGDPVVELQTNFGGGKTHSMLALFHLFSGATAANLPGVESVLEEAEVGQIPRTARPVALVGTALAPGQPETKLDGTVVRTLWGELAWQLGGAAGYALLADSDRHGVNPGSDLLNDLLRRYGPCLILIDEWVAYLRQLYNKESALPAGSFDANLTFAQSLTEAAKRAPRTMLVASLPASDIEIGGEGGREALARLRNTFSRTESAWRPAGAEESFEIVRRRLFQPLAVDKAPARDAVVESFARLYREQPQEFPAACKESEYARRMQVAYPIHPELFDRLYSDWSSLEKFQRTRGVLRLMAAVIHALWERNDANLLILPASVPLEESAVRSELTRYLEDNWPPVLDLDIDGPTSLPLALDRQNPNLGRYSATRRVARTIFFGSAPTFRTNNPGLDERTIKLGCVQPGESVATFGDALRRLADEATHLYVNRNRYWFSTQPSVTRTAQERAAALDVEYVWEELRRRLRADRQRGELAGVHAAPASSGDVPDEQSVRLVILDPTHPHSARNQESEAMRESRTIYSQRGNGPRLYQNMLTFLAADRNRLAELEEGVRQFLAWKSIDDERDALNLDAFQRGQAQTKREQADETVDARIRETYIWLLVPYQSDARNPASLTWEEQRLQGNDPIAVRASKKLKSTEQMISALAALRLVMELDRYDLWQGQEHLGVKQLWEYFARYPYLPRLRDPAVLLEAIRAGIGLLTWREKFAYAEGWDASRRRYLNLKAGDPGASVVLDGAALLVRPEAAQRQLEAEAPAAERTAVPAPGTPSTPPTHGGYPTPAPPPVTAVRERRLRRFYGSVTLNPMRLGRETGVIADEILQHLTSLVGAEVTISLEIHASLPEGAPEQVVRTVTENARTLRFDSFGFEEA